MQNLLKLNYWFNIRAGALETKAQIGLIILIALLAIAAVILHFLMKRKNAKRKILRRWQSFSISNCIIGLALLFFTYERAPLLSARFWFLLWLIAIIIWIVFILRAYREKLKNWEAIKKEEEFKKYLP